MFIFGAFGSDVELTILSVKKGVRTVQKRRADD